MSFPLIPSFPLRQRFQFLQTFKYIFYPLYIVESIIKGFGARIPALIIHGSNLIFLSFSFLIYTITIIMINYYYHNKYNNNDNCHEHLLKAYSALTHI